MGDRAVVSVRERVEQDSLFLDSGVVSHGFAAFLRDYDVVIEVPAAMPDGRSSYVMGRYRYRFTHCVEAHASSSVAPATWQRSWADLFTDYAAWEAAGNPDGYVWGVESSDAYPGLSYVESSDHARSWSKRLGRAMHEVLIETNAVTLRLVFHDLRIDRLAVGDPATGEVEPD